MELQKRLPWLAIKETSPQDAQSTVTETTQTTTWSKQNVKIFEKSSFWQKHAKKMDDYDSMYFSHLFSSSRWLTRCRTKIELVFSSFVGQNVKIKQKKMIIKIYSWLLTNLSFVKNIIWTI